MKNAKLQTELSQKITDVLLLILSIVAIVCLMTGCASPTKPFPVSPSLTQPCQKLTPLEGKTGADVLAKLIEVSAMYYDCADSKDALIKATK